MGPETLRRLRAITEQNLIQARIDAESARRCSNEDLSTHRWGNEENCNNQQIDPIAAMAEKKQRSAEALRDFILTCGPSTRVEVGAEVVVSMFYDNHPDLSFREQTYVFTPLELNGVSTPAGSPGTLQSVTSPLFRAIRNARVNEAYTGKTDNGLEFVALVHKVK